MANVYNDPGADLIRYTEANNTAANLTASLKYCQSGIATDTGLHCHKDHVGTFHESAAKSVLTVGTIPMGKTIATGVYEDSTIHQIGGLIGIGTGANAIRENLELRTASGISADILLAEDTVSGWRIRNSQTTGSFLISRTTDFSTYENVLGLFPSGNIEMYSTSTSLTMYRYSNNTTGTALNSYKARGTSATPLDIDANDTVATWSATARYSSAWLGMGGLNFVSGSSANKCMLKFYLQDGTTFAERMRISYEGTLAVYSQGDSWSAYRYTENTSGVRKRTYKARGTQADPADAIANDYIYEQIHYARLSSAYVNTAAQYNILRNVNGATDWRLLLHSGSSIETRIMVSYDGIFQNGVDKPVYLAANNPIVGFNAYYRSGWRYGEGSAVNYAAAVVHDVGNGLFEIKNTSAPGNAHAAATLISRLAINKAGQFGFNNSSLSSNVTAEIRNVDGNDTESILDLVSTSTTDTYETGDFVRMYQISSDGKTLFGKLTAYDQSSNYYGGLSIWGYSWHLNNPGVFLCGVKATGSTLAAIELDGRQDSSAIASNDLLYCLRNYGSSVMEVSGDSKFYITCGLTHGVTSYLPTNARFGIKTGTIDGSGPNGSGGAEIVSIVQGGTSSTATTPFIFRGINTGDSPYQCFEFIGQKKSGTGGTTVTCDLLAVKNHTTKVLSLSAAGCLSLTGTVPLRISNVQEYADNAAAAAGGLSNGSVYRTGDALKVVHS